jgi:hypothetical protein
MGVSLDGINQGTATGWGTDFGILVNPPFLKNLQLGVMVQDAIGYSGEEGISNGTHVNHHEGAWEKIFPTSFKFGLAYRYKDKGLIAIDLDNRIHFGLEISPHPMGAIQMGIQRDLDNDESPTYSMGGILRYKGVEFSSAYVIPPALEDTLLFALSFNLEYKRTIQIEHVRLNPIYPAHHNHYAKIDQKAKIIPLEAKEKPEFRSEDEFNSVYRLEAEEIGRIWLKNPSKRKVGNVSVYILPIDHIENFVLVRKDLSFEPEQRIAIQIPQLPLKPTEILQHKQMGTTPVRVMVRTGAEEEDIEDELTRNFEVYGRNHIGTDEIVALGSFISSEDELVRGFADRIIKTWKEEWEAEWGVEVKNLTENLIKALLLFNALSEVTYVPDPNIFGGRDIVDEIKYPPEMLMTLAESVDANQSPEPIGDCDDSTVLLCSLFESVGICTALIKPPGHLLMAFNIGISIHEAEKKMGAEEVFIPISTTKVKNEAWIPLETTNFKSGLAAAWRDAKKRMDKVGEFGEVTDPDQRFTPRELAYPPANFSILEGNIPPQPNPEKLRSRLIKDLKDSWILNLKE